MSVRDIRYYSQRLFNLSKISTTICCARITALTIFHAQTQGADATFEKEPQTQNDINVNTILIQTVSPR